MSTLACLSSTPFPTNPPPRRHMEVTFGSGLVTFKRNKLQILVPNARRKKRRPWWERLFLDVDVKSWFAGDLDEEDVHVEEGEDEEERKFEAWRSRAEVITELREAREDAVSSESRVWEDWISEDSDVSRESWDWGADGGEGGGDGGEELDGVSPERDLVRSVREFVYRNDDDLLFEDRVFKYASVNSAKFLAVLILVPWALDFVVHDYILMPFLDRYVETVPLAAEFLDVRKSQKLEMIKVLKLEKARYQFEVEIGQAPPLSDDEIWLELHDKALELRDEWRLENRKSFANIWSDMVFGITLFLLIYFNQSRVALLKFTGYKLLNNVSDTGKAFLIILVTDIFLGYHSESGWQTLVASILEHYGQEVDKAAVTIFVCTVPVIVDACVKLWVYKFLPRLSPNVTTIFREMTRH